MEQMEQLQRAVQEIEALESIYGYDIGGFTVHSEAELLAAQTTLEAGRVDADWVAPPLEIEIELDLDGVEGAPKARLKCGLPPGYPERAAAVSVSVASLRRGAQDVLTAQLTAKAQTLAGDEAVMELVQALQELAPQVVANESAAPPSSDRQRKTAPPSAANDALPTRGNGRRWIWVHHIKDGERRAAIVQEARERALGGYLKPGYPGIVVIEGCSAACDSFTAWIKGNKSRPGGFGRQWGHHVRGEIALPSDVRQLPTAFEELEETSSMGALGSACKAHGLEEEFCEYVLQHKATPSSAATAAATAAAAAAGGGDKHGRAALQHGGPPTAAAAAANEGAAGVEGVAQEAAAAAAGGAGVACARSFLYAHHIRTKQALVYAWAAELQLSGRVKIGWPGWMYLEGSVQAMATFTKRVKAEHWRRITPKWDEVVPWPPPPSVSPPPPPPPPPPASAATVSGLGDEDIARGEDGGGGSSSSGAGTGGTSKTARRRQQVRKREQHANAEAGAGEGVCVGGRRMARLFPDGVRELEAAEFCAAFRAVGREDILQAGTGLLTTGTSTRSS